MTSVLMRDTQRLEPCSHKPRTAWGYQKLEEARKDSLLVPLERAWFSADTLIWDFRPPEL